MAGESIDYESLVHSALRGVVRDALAGAAQAGLPGEHHFYIAFRTATADIAPRLRARFPDDMTIVLQHRFRDLEVSADRFAVTLSFDGAWERLVVPFAAVTSFADPHAQFALKFEPEGGAAAKAAPADTASETPAADGGGFESRQGTVVKVDFPGRGAGGRKRE